MSMSTLLSSDFISLVLRVAVGGVLVAHGVPKARGGWGERSGRWIGSMGVPPVFARLVTLLEVFGGAFLVAGLLVPLVAVLFAIQFAAIIAMKARRMGAGLVSGGNKPNFELDFAYLLLSLVVLFLGAGAYSVDGLVGIL